MQSYNLKSASGSIPGVPKILMLPMFIDSANRVASATFVVDQTHPVLASGKLYCKKNFWLGVLEFLEKAS